MTTSSSDSGFDLPANAFDVASAWRGPALDTDDWVVGASQALISELEAAARTALARGKAVEALTAEDFAGPNLRAIANRLLTELDGGRGFALLRGFPVERWGDELAAMAFLGLGLSLGVLSSQNAAGDLLGHVRDTGADPNDPSIRLYKTREAQPFHTDGADVIALLCLRPAKRGGASRIVSSTSVFQEIQRKRPDLFPLLFEPFYFDRNEEQRAGEPPAFPLPIAHWDGKRLRGFYIGWYIRDAQRHDVVPRLTDEQNELLDLVDATAADASLYLEMDFQPGDVQLLKNSSIFHARSEYEDWDEPERKRHLLRFWATARGDFSGSDERLKAGIAKKDGVASDSESLGH